MSKKLLPSKKSLREILMQSLFDPREQGPMQVILSQNDPRYFEFRAIEMIKEAQLAQEPLVYHEKMSKAITLLGMARLYCK